jgi:hypothetical protein
MAGLNCGYKYTYSADNRKSKELSQGVHYSELSKKWVVRVPNNTTSVNIKPFISVGQFSTKAEAEKKYNELLNKI